MTPLTILPTAVAVALAGGLATVKITTSAVQPLQKGDTMLAAGLPAVVVSKCTKQGTDSIVEIPVPTGDAEALRLAVQERIDATLELSFTRE